MSNTEPTDPQNGLIVTVPKDSRYIMNTSGESGIKTDQAKQLDALLNQSVRVLNKNHDTEEKYASMTSKWDNRSPSPFNSLNTQTKKTRAEKKGTNSIS